MYWRFEIFQDLDSPSSFGSAHASHQALVTPSSRKPSRESRMQRDTRREIIIPGKVSDCQSARRVPEELHMIQEIWQHHRVFIEEKEIDKSGSEKPLQPIPLPCFSGKAKENVWTTAIVLSLWLTMPRVLGLVPSYPSSEMHLGKLPDHTEFQSWGLLEGEESHTRLAVDQGNRSSQIAGWLQHFKIHNGPRFPCLWWIGFDDGVGIEELLRWANTLPEEDQCRSSKSSEGQPISQREANRLFDLWVFSTYWILWWNSRIIRAVQY